MKIMSVILGTLCCILVYELFFGHNGIQQYKAVAAQIEVVQQKSLELQSRNQGVMDQINDLRSGNVAIEELARSELGLIKPNERFFRVLATDDEIRAMQI